MAITAGWNSRKITPYFLNFMEILIPTMAFMKVVVVRCRFLWMQKVMEKLVVKGIVN